MTLLDEPPVVTEPAVEQQAVTAMPSEWRLALRLARRETRRRPGRTVLAALLIAIPVMAMTIGGVFARSESGSWPAQFERRFGDADIAVDSSQFASPTTDAPTVTLPSGTTSLDFIWVNTQLSTSDATTPFWFATITDIDLGDPANGAPIEVIDGRVPRDGEILLPVDLAAALHVTIGDDLTLERPAGTWTVSGFGRVRDSYPTDVLVIPGFDRARIADGYDMNITLYRLPDGASPTNVQQLAGELGGVTRFADPYDFGDSGLRWGMAWGWVAGSLALVAVGIIVAAAFATSARRQLVTIGQLTSNGATESTVRRTLALQGTWTGLAGATAGITIGLVSLPVVKPLIERHILQHDVARLRFSATDLIVIAMTATVAGTLAAAVPARSASRIPVMAALAGRRPLGTLPKWLVPTGLLLLAGGLGLVAIASLGINASSSSGTGSADVWALLIVLGAVSVIFGMCCATPLLIERVGGLGRRTSLSWRLALRSLARSRTRSSAVVAAIAVAVGGSVAAGAIAETAIRERAAGWNASVPADTIVFDAYRYQEALYENDGSNPVIDLEALSPATVPEDLRNGVLAIAADATINPIRVATSDPAPFDTRTGEGVWSDERGLRIADPALLDILGLSDADIEVLTETGSLQPLGRYELANPGTSVAPFATEVGDFGAQLLQYQGPDGIIELSITPATSPYRYDYAGWNAALLTEAYARELGFEIVERGAIVRSPEALTVAQRDALSELQQSQYGQVDAFVEPGDPPRVTDQPVVDEEWSVIYDEPRWRAGNASDLWIARLVILGAVVLLSLLVVSIGLALAAAEGRDERNVLAVVGATPASMRRQASARASVLALSGIALGIPTGFLPAWVLYSVLNADSSISVEPLRFPWLVVGSLLVIVPLLVAGVAWTGSGIGQRLRPPTPTRRD
ncbi:MAG: ABC transporter permease [Ilumatobacter sp.]